MIISSIKNSVNDFFYVSGFICRTFKETLKLLTSMKIGNKVLTMQILFTGFEALGVVFFLGVSIGAIIIIYGMSLLPQFGQDQLTYSILIIIITRELGPVLTAFIIIARSGTAIATELGTMVINHEIEAYISTGIDPISYLVVPRFLGVTISLFLLNIYFNIAGLAGSFFVSQIFTQITTYEYFKNIMLTLKAADLFSSLVKSLVFGIIISITAAYSGLKVENASTEIPQVVIKSVSKGFILCIIADAVITAIYYL